MLAVLFAPAPESAHGVREGEVSAGGVSDVAAGALSACGNRTAPNGSQEAL